MIDDNSIEGSGLEKRYQVFISSTFQDLQNARQEVSQALLRADCFPAGMELFPAADEEQFEFIKTVIDQSDYYIIISAGRYGSIHPETGLSYTEMEYDYAVAVGKPVIRLLHKDPKSISDEGDGKLSKLLAFREKISNSSLVAYWETSDQLGKEVTFALLEVRRTKPSVGWVKADQMASSDAQLEIERLKRQLLELEAYSSNVKDTPKKIDALIEGFEGQVELEVKTLKRVEDEDKPGRPETVEVQTETISLKASILLKMVALTCERPRQRDYISGEVARNLVSTNSEVFSNPNFDFALLTDDSVVAGALYQLVAYDILDRTVVKNQSQNALSLFATGPVDQWEATPSAKAWIASKMASVLLKTD